MKLYYKPGACSVASHIMLHEVGAEFDIESVDTDANLTASGNDYLQLNPNGYVPTLETDGGELITEGAAVLQYIADTNPDRAYSPALGSVERARLQQFLNYTSSEVHKSWSPLFTEGTTEAEAQAAEKKVRSKFDYIETVLSDGREFLVGGTFSAADAFMFIVAFWSNFKAVDLANWPNLKAYVDRIAARPSTQAVFAAEGLA